MHGSVFACQSDNSSDSSLTTHLEQTPQIELLRDRINAGEAADAIPILERLIADLQDEPSASNDVLIEPYLLLGDANYRLEQYTNALQAYRHAFDISRVSRGLHSPSLIKIAYREANILARMGAWQSANSRHEYAYGVVLKAWDDEAHPDRIQGVIRLVDWYESTYKFRGAIVLYDELRKHVKQNYPPADPFALAVRRNYVHALREIRYPMPETKLAPRFRVQVPGWDPRAFRKRTSIYELGKNELEGIGQIVLSNPVATDVERASVLLDLADWHVLFNRPHQGIQIYREAWDLLERTPDLLAHAFDEPNLIHMNVTRSYVSPDRASGGQRSLGVVRLKLHINDRGKVVGRKTVSTAPDNRMEYRVRVIAEHAKYRPAFENREPVRARNVPFVYNYSLYSRSLARQ